MGNCMSYRKKKISNYNPNKNHINRNVNLSVIIPSDDYIIPSDDYIISRRFKASLDS